LNNTSRQAAIQIVLLGCIALALGQFFRPTWSWAFFALGLLWMLVQHQRNLARLERWLALPTPVTVPEGSSGVWDDLFAAIYHHERAQAWRLKEYERTLARFRLAGQALTDGVVVLDGGNRIQWCNETAERQLGIHYQTDAGQPLQNLVRQPAFVEFLAANDFGRAFQMRIDRGHELVLLLQIVSYGEDERLMHVKDVTQSERLDRMRQDFVANVSHELRTPLTVMSGFLETIRELKLDPAQREHYLSLMSDQSIRMLRIVEDLLTLSSLESAPPPQDQRIMINALMARLREDAEALSAGRHKIVMQSATGFNLLGSEFEIQSAFSNLVSNAVRYTPAGGEIRINWQADSTGGTFSVTDSGIGIEKTHLPRLTERFYRVDRGRSRETGGTGLGLAIVKHALMRHQSQLEIQSELGKGSSFSARFSARRLSAALGVNPSVASNRGNQGLQAAK
jgi:two-component system phosphate regulon sensor histidine kinase PhoR